MFGRNLGNGTFANITSISGLDTVNSCLNTGATWFDYDNDGLLDIVGDGEGQVDHQSVSMSSKKKARSARPRVTAVSLLHVSHLQNLTDVGLGMYAMYNVSQVSIRLYEVFPFR